MIGVVSFITPISLLPWSSSTLTVRYCPLVVIHLNARKTQSRKAVATTSPRKLSPAILRPDGPLGFSDVTGGRVVEAGDVVVVEEVVVDVNVVVDVKVVDVVEDVVEVVVDVEVEVVVELASQNHKGQLNDGIFSSWKRELKAKAY